MNRRLTTIAALSLTALMAAACGGSDDAQEAAGEAVQVESTEVMAPATTAATTAAGAASVTTAAGTPTTAAATPTTAAVTPTTAAGGITASITQARSGQQLRLTVDAADPGVRTGSKQGIRRVCAVRYNEYGNAVNGGGTTCAGAPEQAVYGEYTKVWTQTVGCVTHAYKQIDVIVDAENGETKKFKVASPAC
ncbi:MAG: hypothetical protein FJW83_05215 [Actinobacteria bacterium]|nr:hypothetical protein [Actinomycetota bacterium]